MSWMPGTPPVTPVAIRTLTSGARIIGSSLLAREGANALLNFARGAYSKKATVSLTKTKTMPRVKKTIGKSKVSAAMKKEIRKIAMRTTEIKNCSTGTATSGLKHATQQAYCETAIITNGTNSLQRVGDEIFLQALRVQWLITTPSTAGAYSYRLMVVYSGEEYAATSFADTSLTFAEMFLINAVAGTNVAGVVNKKAITVLWDQIVDVNSNITGVSEVVNTFCNVNLRNYRFQYQAGGSTYGKLKNLYVVVLPYVVGGTVGTTLCGTVVANASLDFRDP